MHLARSSISLALVICTPFILHLYLLDGLDGALWSLPLKEDTAYAPDYTDRGFRKVRIGMSRNDVTELLGEPIETWIITEVTPTIEYGAWSTSPLDTHYRRRLVAFSENRVVRIVSEFWVD